MGHAFDKVLYDIDVCPDDIYERKNVHVLYTYCKYFAANLKFSVQYDFEIQLITKFEIVNLIINYHVLFA